MKPIANNLFEWSYDTITFAASQVLANAPYAMFATAYDNVSKFFWQTNNPKSGVCSYSAMNILGIAIEFFTNGISGPIPSLDDVTKISKNCSLAIYKNTVPVLQLPISAIPGGNQLAGYVSNTNNSVIAIAENGAAHKENIFWIGPNADGGNVSVGIPFVKDEPLDIRIVAEYTFTPAVQTYMKLKFWCDTYQQLGAVAA